VNKFWLFLLALVMSMGMTACNSTSAPDSPLVGKWVEPSVHVDQVGEPGQPNFSPEQTTTNHYAFASNGSVTKTQIIQVVSAPTLPSNFNQGTWSVSGNALTLTFDGLSPATFTFAVNGSSLDVTNAAGTTIKLTRE
jgi:hypothetical protein